MPTLNLVTSVGADDARERNDSALFNGTATSMDVTSDPTSGSRWNSGALFDPVNIANAVTIDTATLTPYFNGVSLDDMHADWGCQDVDDAVNFVTDPDVTTRMGSITTSLVAWVQDSVGAGYQAMPGDFKGPIKEIVDRVGWNSGQAICVLGRGNGDAAAIARINTIEAGFGGMKLDITYTSAVTQTITPSPVVFTLSVPVPQLNLGYTPSPVVFTLSVPVPQLNLGYTPSPVVFTLSVPTPKLNFISLPTAVPFILTLPTPQLNLGYTPSPVVLTLTFPTPTVGAVGSLMDTPIEVDGRHAPVISLVGRSSSTISVKGRGNQV